MPTAEGLYLFCTYLYRILYNITGQNIITLFVNISLIFGSEAWLNLFWKYINPKLFAVRYAASLFIVRSDVPQSTFTVHYVR